jgi:gliding motility-associated-like protein
MIIMNKIKNIFLICSFAYFSSTCFGNLRCKYSFLNNKTINVSNLVALNTDTNFVNISACDSLFWNGNWYNTSGNYIYTTVNSSGFDSTIVMSLNISRNTTSESNVIACNSYNWNGITYNTSGTYTFISNNSVGCDSIAKLDLTINNSSALELNLEACESYTWNGTTYTSSGTYFQYSTNTLSCDSITSLNLSIKNASFSFDETSACDSYFWNEDTYTTSGIYEYNTVNINGCDSVATLILTINSASNVTNQRIVSCKNYEFNGNVYTEEGQYHDTLVNVNGCDSIVFLNLSFVKDLQLPNAFTPNLDNKNDTFPSIEIDLEDYRLMILNSWGQEVYFSNSSKNSWDGKFKGKYCQNGTYYYMMNYNCKGLSTNRNGQIMLFK